MIREIDPATQNSKVSLIHAIRLMSQADDLVRRFAAQAFHENCPNSVCAAIGLLNSDDERDRSASANALIHASVKSRIGPEFKYAVAELIRALSSPTDHTRYAAAVILRDIGPRARKAVPSLVQALNDPYRATRTAAVWALLTIAPETKQRIPKLIDLLKEEVSDQISWLRHEHENVRVEAAETLGRIGPEAKSAIPSLREALSDRVVDVRLVAAQALWKIDKCGQEALWVLIGGLTDNRSPTRSWVASVLGEIGGEAKAAVPALVEALRDDDVNVRCRAAQALGQIGMPSKDAAHALVEALKDAEGSVRAAAAEALGGISLDADVIGPALIGVLADNLDVRRSAIAALGRVRPVRKEAINAVASVCADSDHEYSLRQTAVTVLGEMSREADEAILALIEALKHDPLKMIALPALSKLGPRAEMATGRLIELLTDANSHVRAAAASALGQIGSPASTAIEPLVELLNDKESGIRGIAVWALAQIDPCDRRTVKAIIDDLTNKDNDSPDAALRAIGTNPTALVQPLIGELSKPDAETRARAAIALGRIGLEARVAVPRLVGLLTDLDVDVRGTAAEALRELGPDARIAVPQLVPLVQDSSVLVRWRAKCTVGVLDPVRMETGQPELTDKEKDAIQWIIRLKTTDEVDVGNGASQDFEKSCPVSIILRLLTDINDHVRWSANRAFLARGPEAIATCIDLLNNSDPFERQIAANALRNASVQEKIGPAFAQHVPVLREALSNSIDDMRYVAVITLRTLGGAAREAVPDLAKALKDVSPAIRMEAARALGAIGASATDSVAHLVSAFGDDDNYYVRAACAAAMASVDPNILHSVATEAVPILAEAMRTRELREECASALSLIGAPAAPALVECLRSDDEGIVDSAADALEDMGTLAVPFLAELLTGKDSGLRGLAVVILEHMYPVGVGAFAEGLRNGDDDARANIVDTLTRLAPRLGPDGVILLSGAMKLKHAFVRMFAAIGLGKYGPSAKEAVPALIEALRVDRSELDDILAGMNVLDALASIGPAAVPDLILALKDTDASVRRGAAAALLRIGPEARAAIPSLIELQADENEQVRGAAVAAISKIDPGHTPEASQISRKTAPPAAQKKVHCSYCGQEYLTAPSEKCPLCGKTGGMHVLSD